ncbi:MAG: hypothetical protein JSV52_07760 [Candidatus Zixiibacteriota bacterium]|nr:MAG: hypothetical protein JSV52_07760 [candidate division Zixibacteria bacterium]
MRLFSRKRKHTSSVAARVDAMATKVRTPGSAPFKTVSGLGRILDCPGAEVSSGRYRIALYRFLSENIPVISACVSTWARLSSAPGDFEIIDDAGTRDTERAREQMSQLAARVYQGSLGHQGSMVTFLTEIFASLFRDGVFAGFLTVKKDGTGVDRFVPIDSSGLTVNCDGGGTRLTLELDAGAICLNRSDFYYIPMNSDISRPLGRSILQAIPLVAYIEQQLVDDMRRSSHNSGFHRLHVQVTPPERMAGESDQAYMERINGYFDSTVSMIKSCGVDENPVTWDNVSIESIGPDNVRAVTNSWFVNHRGMIEEICAGTNLAPFLLGYSYGATTTWSSFKFDLVMRQVRSVQAQVSAFLEWIGNIELALAGIDARCRFRFDNSFAYQAIEEAKINSTHVDSLLKLYESGLIDKQTAREKAGKLL